MPVWERKHSCLQNDRAIGCVKPPLSLPLFLGKSPFLTWIVRRIRLQPSIQATSSLRSMYSGTVLNQIKGHVIFKYIFSNLDWIKPSPVILQELIWPKNGEWFFKFLYSNYNHCSALRLLICLSILLIFVDFVSTAVCGDCEDCTLTGYLGYWIIQDRPSRSGKDLLKISRPGYF